MDRRRFHRLCGGLLGGAALLHRDARASAADGDWPRSRLVDTDQRPITLASLTPGDALVFHYPYVTSPCFLIRLDNATDEGNWPGGLGTDNSVVAFSAICSHKMSHPAKPISHIAYRREPVSFKAADGSRQEQRGLISCCSERSVYDPARGASVLAGPAPVPLAAIALDIDSDGAICATDSLGENRYERFFDTFGFRLAMEHGVADVRAPSEADVIATPAATYSRQQIRC